MYCVRSGCARRYVAQSLCTRNFMQVKCSLSAGSKSWHECLGISRNESIRQSRFSSTMTSPERIEKRSSTESLSKEDIKQSRGRLFFTNANSLKLVMPMPHNSESITFLLHTQQPLSYLETLIRNELTEAHPSPKITFWDVHRHSRWSTGVQISEFIREGAASKRFCIDISGTKENASITVNVPSFEDRTQFLRAQLGKLTDTRKDKDFL
jgi:hypothetical protein